MSDIVSREEARKLIQLRTAVDEMIRLNEIVTTLGGGFSLDIKGGATTRISLAPFIQAVRPSSFQVIDVRYRHQPDSSEVTFWVMNIEDDRQTLYSNLGIKSINWASPMMVTETVPGLSEAKFAFRVPNDLLTDANVLYFSGMCTALQKVNLDYAVSQLFKAG